jgi:hypothetical protein
MGAGNAYVEGIVKTMNAEGKLGSEDLEQLHPRELTKVMVALRKHEQRGVVFEERAETSTALARNYENREAEPTSHPF